MDPSVGERNMLMPPAGTERRRARRHERWPGRAQRHADGVMRLERRTRRRRRRRRRRARGGRATGGGTEEDKHTLAGDSVASAPV